VEHTTQVEVIERWLAMHRNGTTQLADDVMELDTSVYTSHEWFAAERVALFQERAVVACLSADVREPGDFVTLDAGGVPLLVVRDDDGTVRAFVNACRHRATQVAHGCGTAKNFACPFHNWTYARDGRLLGQPRAQGGFASVDRATLGLVAVPAGEGHGLVLVRPGGGAPVDVAAEIGPQIARDLDALGLAGHHVWAREQRTWHANWKLILDTFTESYHVFALHGASVGPDYPGHVMVFDAFGPHLRIPVPRATLLDLEARPRDTWDLLAHATVQFHLAPNAMVNHTIDHVILWRFEPEAPDRTVATMTMYTPDPRAAHAPDDAWTQSMIAWFDLHDAVTRDEDYPESERIQRVLSSGRAPSTLLGRNEGAVQHVHRFVRAAVDEHRSRAGSPAS
jgi:phenylpropionate dioxygenase-like ring-hydroxylating dioxygenase large terminal subunit